MKSGIFNFLETSGTLRPATGLLIYLRKYVGDQENGFCVLFYSVLPYMTTSVKVEYKACLSGAMNLLR